VSGDHPFSKPDPRLFQVALEKAQVTASQAVHVGDSFASDVFGAQAAGIRPIWFKRGGKPVPKNAEPELQIVHNFTDHQLASTICPCTLHKKML
jgi:putative hydrolase of the HAD superfamily